MPDWGDIIKEASVVIGIVVALLFVRELLKIFAPYIQRKLQSDDACGPAGLEWDEMCDRLEKIEGCVTEALAKVRQLFEWHDVSDADGVKVWYVRQSFYAALDRMEQTDQKIAEILQEVSAGQRDQLRAIEAMVRQLERMEDRGRQGIPRS